jgi:hypothetical protein
MRLTWISHFYPGILILITNYVFPFLGVTFVLVKRGTNYKTFWDGVEKWRKQQEVLENTDSPAEENSYEALE